MHIYGIILLYIIEYSLTAVSSTIHILYTRSNIIWFGPKRFTLLSLILVHVWHNIIMYYPCGHHSIQIGFRIPLILVCWLIDLCILVLWCFYICTQWCIYYLIFLTEGCHLRLDTNSKHPLFAKFIITLFKNIYIKLYTCLFRYIFVSLTNIETQLLAYCYLNVY